ncbi:MAG: rubrerythrin family protein [Desulfobulbaceae bacterium]|uniref:Rubrerythrin family protein n=1 Tax=Candidatus Desulfobia pelagia TaxID=2841692 RepID=A0A8J6NE52_9BACT|nr:rubrerythrin family protein [Candidatus Desulfobia pelagia]
MQSQEEKLLTTYGMLMKASARKKIYSQKAIKEGHEAAGRLLRAVSVSEAVQARRILNLLKGPIDLSEEYLSTIFEQEITPVLQQYTQNIEDLSQAGIPSIPQVLKQLWSAERHLKSFYSNDTEDISIEEDDRLYVCNFCGYMSVNNAPDSCPLCRAEKKAFKQID